MTAQLRSLLYLSHGERSDRSCDPGEGDQHIDRPYPLTPTLSPWEREYIEFAAFAFHCNGHLEYPLLDRIH